MSSGGFSNVRLGRMHDVLAGYVERGELPGLVALVARRGEVHVEAIGRQAFDGAPMRRDTIFLIRSLSKAISAAAASILLEECRLRLDDPVDPWLPELADRRVLRRIDGPLDDTVPAARPITVRDVLTFRLGYGQLVESAETHPILGAMRELGIDTGPPNAPGLPGPDEWLRRLGTLPLMHQPGERWVYNTGADVLGVLMARVSGQPLDVFLRERIFAPLGMQDTGFEVPADKLDRFATVYSYEIDPKMGARPVADDPANSAWSRPPTLPSAAGNLVSTVDDYLAFARMLLNGGKHGRERLLSRPAIELMTSNQLTDEQRVTARSILDDNCGWGFGVAVIMRRDAIWATPGRYGWYGGLESTWFSDPREELVTILLASCLTSTDGWPTIWTDFWTTAYAAIDD